ncbi:MAG TPA: hypothetical protein VMC79_15160 [Rectinemataceae bacterium]|nr:hypothetical protein [Rectinemataceae bacterium]
MDALKQETKRELIRRVFPDLQYGGDPDVERYFEHRRERRVAEALSIYNGKLRVRYPDDSARVTLLRLYREHDPRYAGFQERLVMDLAGRLAARISGNIDLLVSHLAKARLDDAFEALKAVETLLARFGGDSEAALVQLSRYEEFSRILNHHSLLTRRALELVREYDAVARADSPADYDFIARSEAIEARRREARSPVGAGERQSVTEERYDFVAMSARRESRERAEARSRTRYFDPSKIRFGPDEKKRVEIPRTLKRREDRVLVYCAKYWNQVRDPAFDRLVFLYSRKYGSSHYEIFRAIKTGRLRGANDDEILSAVSAILTTSYSYSVTGDLYMQVMWRRLRARMQAEAVEFRLARPGPESRVRAAHEERRKTSTVAEPKVPPLSRPAPEQRVARVAGTEPQSRIRQEAVAAPAPARRIEPARAEPPPVVGAPHGIPLRGKGSPDRLEDRSPPPGALLSSTSMVHGSRLLARAPSGPEPVPKIVGRGGSISDKVRSLSGKSYDVYREIFLERVRTDIHRHLLAHQSKTHGLFDTAANDAEDQIFAFMQAHYDDPFMDWRNAAERTVVESLGFVLPSLDPIIEACFKRL